MSESNEGRWLQSFWVQFFTIRASNFQSVMLQDGEEKEKKYIKKWNDFFESIVSR